MSGVIQVSELDEDVTSYKQREKEVTKEFLLGVIELGNILRMQRDKWKSKGKWIEYLEKIGKHVSGANQMIRLYEYSLEHKKEILKSNLTNWNKVNLFLALEDEEKLKLADAIDGKDVSSDAFREEVKTIKNVPPHELIELDPLPESSLKLDDSSKFMELLDDVILTSSSVDVAKVLAELQKEFPFITEKSEAIATAYFFIQKAIGMLIDKPHLNDEERSFFRTRFVDQLQSLEVVLKKNL